MTIFNIAPDQLSEIVCGVAAGPTNDYQVLPSSLNFNEGQREEILYSRAEDGGNVRKVRRSLVPVEFTIIIWGSSQANALSNARTFSRAIQHKRGGYLKYRPRGLDSALTTYYHYLPSPPLRPITRAYARDLSQERRLQVGRLETDYGITYGVRLMTRPWATSDPENLVTILGATAIENADDATYDNYVETTSSSVKGDAIFPVVRISNDGTTKHRVFMHHFKEATGLSTRKDYVEAEVFTGEGGGGWSSQPDSTASDGNRAETSNASTYIYRTFANLNLDDAYVGKIAPWVRAAVSDGSTTYNIRVTAYQGTTLLAETQYLTVDQTAWETHFFREIDIPPFGIPGRINDGSTPDTSQFIGNAQLRIEAERTAGSGDIYLDYIVLSKASNFIAIFQDGVLSGGSNYIEVERPSQTFFEADGGIVVDSASWGKYGTPISILVFEKSYDHRLRFHFSLLSAGKYQDEIAYPFSITILGIYATIAPFEES